MGNKLSEREVEAIEMLDDPTYTAEFIEEYMSKTREEKDAAINLPAALQSMAVDGFMSAVRCIVDKELL